MLVTIFFGVPVLTGVLVGWTENDPRTVSQSYLPDPYVILPAPGQRTHRVSRPRELAHGLRISRISDYFLS